MGGCRVRSTNPAWFWRHQPFLPRSTQQPVWWSIQEHIFWDAKLISLAWNRHASHPPHSGSSLTIIPQREGHFLFNLYPMSVSRARAACLISPMPLTMYSDSKQERKCFSPKFGIGWSSLFALWRVCVTLMMIHYVITCYIFFTRMTGERYYIYFSFLLSWI